MVILVGFLLCLEGWFVGRIFLGPVAVRTVADAPPASAVCVFLCPSPKSKAILDEGDAEPRTGAEASSMGCMEEVGEEEANELEGYRNQQIPEEGEYGSGGEVVDDHVIG
jgi:hypothetical protein